MNRMGRIRCWTLRCFMVLMSCALVSTRMNLGVSESTGSGNNVNGLITRALLQALPRVVGGKDATKGRFPYMVSVRTSERRHRCGGVLIASRWVLTAAHCFDDAQPLALHSNPFLLIGAHGYDDSGADDGVEEMVGFEVFKHEEYKTVTGGFDIALIQLPRSAKSKVFANLPTSRAALRAGNIVSALGWGKTGKGPFPETLQYAELEFIPNNNCNKLWKGFGTVVKKSMICATAATADTCAGDSGGPLLQVNTLRNDVNKGNPNADIVMGITSFGDTNCTSFERPGVYTKVTDHRAWILRKMKSPTRKQKEVKKEIEQPPTPASVPPQAVKPGCPERYQVMSGDTCQKIWVKAGINEATFRALNPGLDETCGLAIGDELCLPSSSQAAATASPCKTTHTVITGDTCFKLWRKYRLTEQAFREMNPELNSSCDVFPGSELCVATGG